MSDPQPVPSLTTEPSPVFAWPCDCINCRAAAALAVEATDLAGLRLMQIHALEHTVRQLQVALAVWQPMADLYEQDMSGRRARPPLRLAIDDRAVWVRDQVRRLTGRHAEDPGAVADSLQDRDGREG